MSWIEEIEIEEAQGRLKETYENLVEKRGKVSNILRVHSLNPEAMRSHLDFYMSVMFKDSSLSRKESEMIAVVVSAANGCGYCVAHHSEALDHYWRDEDKVRRLSENFKEVELEKRYHKMLEFTHRLTSEPDSIENEEVDSLKDCGFDDRDILNIVLVTGYFNFVNRVALGLGVEYGSEEIKGYQY